ncbi:MAG TPA: GFA family protein [Kofleriaceae bacterium]
MKTYQGSCHCKAVQFEATLEPITAATRCNCRICTKLARFSVMGKPDALRITQGADKLSSFAATGGGGTYEFCSQCGAHPFGHGDLPALGGKFVSINVNCLDDIDPATLEAGYWDGRHNNWQAGLRPQPWPIAEAVRESV